MGNVLVLIVIVNAFLSLTVCLSDPDLDESIQIRISSPDSNHVNILGIGVMGNVLVLIVILTSKSMRSSTNLFLLNLREILYIPLFIGQVCSEYTVCPTSLDQIHIKTGLFDNVGSQIYLSK